MSEPRPAATVMILRDTSAGIEVYLLRRSARSSFMPDVFVFPGGAVDPGDGSPAARERLRGNVAADGAHIFAAARETFEECGLLFTVPDVAPDLRDRARAELAAGGGTFAALLARLDCFVDAAALHYFSRWITPATEPRRFDTHFFAARAPAGQTALADARETHDGIWLGPQTALARCVDGSLALMFPTIKHLERLCAFRRAGDVLAYADTKAVRTVMPAADAASFAVPPDLEGVW